MSDLGYIFDIMARITMERALDLAVALDTNAVSLSRTARAAYQEARNQAQERGDPDSLKLVVRIETRLTGKSTDPVKLE